MRLRLGLITTLAATALAAGCGDATPTADDNAGGSVRTFLQACAEGRGVAAMETLTEPMRDTFIAASDVYTACARVLGASSVDTEKELRDAQVAGVDADGGLATVRLDLPDGERREVEVEYVSGQWLIANPPLFR